MLAIVRADPAGSGLAVTDLAGRTVLTRQLEWLHACGVELVAIEIPSGDLGDRVLEQIQEQDALGRRAIPVFGPLEPEAVAKRAGFDADRPILIIEHNTFGDADLLGLGASTTDGSGSFELAGPEGVDGLVAASVSFLREGPLTLAEPELGWAVALRDATDVRNLGFAMLAGALPKPPTKGGWKPQIHAAEITPGVFTARGSSVDPSAELIAPVLVGPDVFVGPGAKVGPRVVLGHGAVVDRGATVRDALIAGGAYVGEGVTVEGCDVTADGGLIDRTPGAPEEPLRMDPLLVGGVAAPGRTAGRLLTVLLLVLVAPFMLLGSPFVLLLRAVGVRRPYDAGVGFVHRLLEVVRGERAVFGVSDEAVGEGSAPLGVLEAARLAPRGLLIIDGGLVEPDAPRIARLLARAWYARHKRPTVDLQLFWRALSAKRGALTPLSDR